MFYWRSALTWLRCFQTPNGWESRVFFKSVNRHDKFSEEFLGHSKTSILEIRTQDSDLCKQMVTKTNTYLQTSTTSTLTSSPGHITNYSMPNQRRPALSHGSPPLGHSETSILEIRTQDSDPCKQMVTKTNNTCS